MQKPPHAEHGFAARRVRGDIVAFAPHPVLHHEMTKRTEASHAYARRRRDEQQDGQDGDRPA